MDAGALYPITGNPALADLGGVFSGTVTVAPSRDPRTLEPVRIDVNVSAHDGHFRSVRLGTPDRLYMTHAVAYANIDRAVLDHSDIYVAGGVVHLWGRVGRGLASQTVIVDYNGLSIDQLAHVVPGQANGPVPGTLNGTFRLIRSGAGLDGPDRRRPHDHARRRPGQRQGHRQAVRPAPAAAAASSRPAPAASTSASRPARSA